MRIGARGSELHLWLRRINNIVEPLTPPDGHFRSRWKLPPQRLSFGRSTEGSAQRCGTSARHHQHHDHLAKSKATFNKRDKEKKRQQKQEEKKIRKEERKANAPGGGFESMLAYVDENGMITNTPPDPTKRKEVDIEEIELGVPRREKEEVDAERNARRYVSCTRSSSSPCEPSTEHSRQTTGCVRTTSSRTARSSPSRAASNRERSGSSRTMPSWQGVVANSNILGTVRP